MQAQHIALSTEMVEKWGDSVERRFTESLHVFSQDQNDVIERGLDEMIQAVDFTEQQQSFT